MIAATPNSNLVDRSAHVEFDAIVKYGGNQVNNVFILGTTRIIIITRQSIVRQGRFFNDLESRGGANVCRDRL